MMNVENRLVSFLEAEHFSEKEASKLDSLKVIPSLATRFSSCENAILICVEAGEIIFETSFGKAHNDHYDGFDLFKLYLYVAKKREFVSISDLQKDEDWRSIKLSKTLPKFAAVPVFEDDFEDNEVIGIIAIHDEKPSEILSGERETLLHLSSLTASLLSAEKVKRQLHKTESELAHSREAVQKSEAFYHSLVESLPQNILRKDLKGRFTFANRNFCQGLGKPLEEIIGRTDFDFFPASLAEKYRQDDRHVIETGRRFETTEKHQRSRLEQHYVHVVKTPLYDREGEVVGIQGIFWDVTEQRKTEEDLAFKRDLLRSLLDSIPDHVYFKDQSSRFIICSKELSEHLGLNSPDSAVGKTDFDFFSPEHARPAFEDEQRIIATGIPVIGKIEKEILKDGRANWVLTSKMPFCSGSGAIIGTFGVSKDITPLIKTRQELEKAQKKYREIFEKAVEGIFQTSAEGRYLEANPALARIYGYDSAKELLEQITDIGRQLYVDPKRRKVFQERMERRGEVHEFESEIYRRDGTKIWIAETARVVRDAKGKVKYYEGIVEDISERKRSEAALQMARDAALDSTRLKSLFLANMSHEIRTPMNGIIGMASLLRRTELSDDQSHFANAIEQSGLTLLRLIDDILEFSKMESGKMKIEKAPFDPTAMIESIVELLAENAQKKGIEVITHIDLHVPKTIIGDAIRLRQILNNLVGNAIKFTEKGEVHISMKLDCQAHKSPHLKSPHLKFEVEDTGIGIAPEAHSLIFKPFTQADESTTRRFGGTGLGLAISKQLIELMGSKLNVESKLGEGSKFWFSLPFEKIEGLPSSDSSPKKFNGARILIVAENRSVCRHLEQMLIPHGFDCMMVHSFRRARQTYQTAFQNHKPFHYLIADLSVSGNRGLTLCSHIRRSSGGEKVKKLLLCSVGRKTSARRLADCDICGIITKPVRRKNLLDSLDRARSGKKTHSPSCSGIETSPKKPASPKSVSVLVVEDNPVNQSVALHVLKQLGYEGVAVDNGLDALEMLNQTRFPVIFMDCQMPELDGYETTRRIREMESTDASDLPRSRIIAMTANAMEGDRERCLAAGMDDYVSKPIMLPAVEAALLGRESSSASALLMSPRLDHEVLANFKKPKDAPDPLADLAELFEREIVKQIRILQDALDRADSRVFSRTAHTFKGSANNIGARQLAGLCESLEHWKKDLDKSKDEICQIISEIEKEARAVVNELRSIVAKRNQPN